MKKLTPLQQEYLRAADVFHFAYREHFVRLFTGRDGRHKRTERVLPALVKKGFLGSLKYGKRLIYATVDRLNLHPNGKQMTALIPYHGLCCTEALVRYICSDREGEIISERVFRSARFGSIPEWGIRYPNKKLLLLEFSTESNVYARGNIAGKIKRYENSLPKIAEAFEAEPIVVFVFDLPRLETQLFVSNLRAGGDFFFTDYGTFRSVEAGNQLSAPIYIWGEDGGTYPLRND